jgi:hypothetical protein
MTQSPQVTVWKVEVGECIALGCAQEWQCSSVFALSLEKEPAPACFFLPGLLRTSLNKG